MTKKTLAFLVINPVSFTKWCLNVSGDDPIQASPSKRQIRDVLINKEKNKVARDHENVILQFLVSDSSSY